MSPTSGIREMGQWHVSVVAETGSTNDDLLRAAERRELVDRTVLRTEHQTAGRGRLDRRWDAPAGSNLLASMYLLSSGDQPSTRVQRVGVAIVDAIIQLAGSNVAANRLSALGLKWPNDVLLDGRKLAGVLAQRSTSAPGVVVGFGVNLGWAPPDAACVQELVECSPEQLLDGVLDAFDAQPDDPAAFAEVYRARLLTLGQFVRVHLPGNVTFDGRAVGIDADGRIVVISEAAEERVFDVGDVVHLRPGETGVAGASD
jgi:BirA family biotin operon repressor/biotin-[acetyl-CoA-carboxylase] ligase